MPWRESWSQTMTRTSSKFCKSRWKPKGHVVHTTLEGSTALEVMREFAPDLVILDIMMRTDTDGLETAHRIRTDPAYADFSHLPIIMLTNIERMRPFTTQDGQRVESVDVQAFLRKPIEPRAFLDTIDTLLA